MKVKLSSIHSVEDSSYKGDHCYYHQIALGLPSGQVVVPLLSKNQVGSVISMLEEMLASGYSSFYEFPEAYYNSVYIGASTSPDNQMLPL